MHQLAAALAADGVSPRAGEAGRVGRLGPATVGRALVLRLAHLPAAAAALAQSVATLGADIDLAHRCGTPSEARIARMAADEMSNREIARALFLTMKTVAYHLTHVYEKLQISSRAELAEALGGD